MLTKSDLSAIQKMFDVVDKRFDGMDKKFISIDERFDNMDKKLDNLSNQLQKNTEDLVELITSGFNLNEERLGRLETEVFKSN